MAWSATWAAKAGFLSVKSRAARMRVAGAASGSEAQSSAMSRYPAVLAAANHLPLRPCSAIRSSKNPAGIAIRVAFHQIAPHGEPGVARYRGQSEAAIGLIGLVLPQENVFAKSNDLMVAPRLSVALQQGCGAGKRVALAPMAQ